MPRWDLETLGKRALRLSRGAAARHLDVVPAAADIRRGDALGVTVRVNGKKAGRVEVGLVCTETYHSYLPTSDVSKSEDLTVDEIAFEHWVPVENPETQPAVELTVPPDAPFSYTGEHLWLTWRVGIRQPGARGDRPDADARDSRAAVSGEPRLHVEVEGERFLPGETVRGTVLVVEGGDSRRLAVALNYRELTNDEYEATTASVTTGDLHTGDLVAGTSYPFELQLPRDALPNYKSPHGELFWELDAHSDERGRDTHERRRIDVSARR